MLIRVVAAMILLFLLDLVWIKGLAPLLGLDYFAVVQVGEMTACTRQNFFSSASTYLSV